MSESGVGGLAQSATPTLRTLFLEHHQRMVRLAGVLTRDHAVAEDVVQQAYLRIDRKLPRLRDPELARRYLQRTVLTLCRDQGRHRAVAARHPAPPPEMAEGADAAALRRLDRDLLLDAIAELPTRQRQCVVLRFYERMPDDEAAAVLGVSRNSVKKHVQRALATLAARLEAAL